MNTHFTETESKKMKEIYKITSGMPTKTKNKLYRYKMASSEMVVTDYFFAANDEKAIKAAQLLSSPNSLISVCELDTNTEKCIKTIYKQRKNKC